MTPEQTTRRLNIPVTTPARTIADLKRVALGLAKKAVRQAAVVGIHIPEEVDADHTRSELEARFLRLCRRHQLPAPEVNAQIGGLTVDFLWREQRLIVETDGYRYHRGREAFEDDRARDLRLRSHGFDVIRLTHRQLTTERSAVVATLSALLRQSNASAS